MRSNTDIFSLRCFTLSICQTGRGHHHILFNLCLNQLFLNRGFKMQMIYSELGLKGKCGGVRASRIDKLMNDIQCELSVHVMLCLL